MTQHDSLDTIGKLLTGGEGRDAVHIAIAPGVAATKLRPGQWVGFANEGDTITMSPRAAIMLGIVDPFLRQPVEEGQRFWVFLTPRTITGLRHEWTHPAFPAKEKPCTG